MEWWLGRNRTTDTRTFNVGCLRSRRFLTVPKLLILWDESPITHLEQFPRLPAICVVFDAGLHRNYIGRRQLSSLGRG